MGTQSLAASQGLDARCVCARARKRAAVPGSPRLRQGSLGQVKDGGPRQEWGHRDRPGLFRPPRGLRPSCS